MVDARRDSGRDLGDLSVDFAAKELALEEELELSIEEAAPEGMADDDTAAIPPERVRFTAPVKVRCDGQEDLVDGVTLNLSIRGVALCAPVTVPTRQRVWTRFRLGLGEEDLNLLCEVIWSTPAGDNDTTYGLRFVGVTADEQARIKAAVAERSEGRSAAWSLPVMPEPALATGQTHGASPWITAAAGMAAGIGLALALSVIPSRGATQTTVAALERPRVTEPASPPRMLAPATAQKSTESEPAPVKSTPVPMTTSMTATAMPVAPAPSTRTEVVSTPSTKSGKLPKKVGAASKSGDVLKPLGGKDAVQLGLLTDGQVGGHVSFWLEKPRRLVVDILGRKNGFAKSTYEIDNPLVTHLRVGQHKDKVRYVIDTAEDVSTQVKARVMGKTLMLEIKRK